MIKCGGYLRFLRTIISLFRRKNLKLQLRRGTLYNTPLGRRRERVCVTHTLSMSLHCSWASSGGGTAVAPGGFGLGRRVHLRLDGKPLPHHRVDEARSRSGTTSWGLISLNHDVQSATLTSVINSFVFTFFSVISRCREVQRCCFVMHFLFFHSYCHDAAELAAYVSW